MKEIRQIFAVRDGSVLLQTLVICMVLSYIAVSLTQWILARHVSSTELRNTMELGGMVNDAFNFEIPRYLDKCMSSTKPNPDPFECPTNSSNSWGWTQEGFAYNLDGTLEIDFNRLYVMKDEADDKVVECSRRIEKKTTVQKFECTLTVPSFEKFEWEIL